jgi:hypothetical protein
LTPITFWLHAKTGSCFILVENFRIQANRDGAQQELVEWVRLSNEDAKLKRDGLTPAGMEIRGFSGWFVRSG